MPFAERGWPRRVLILGGTGEAAALARALAGRPGLSVVTSLAGRTSAPADLAGTVRVGGFGGAEGLREYLRAESIDRVIDATHPYAARMTANAVEACAAAGVPLLRLERPPWIPAAGDRWLGVADAAEAAALLAAPPAGLLPRRPLRVFLTVGQRELDAFAGVPEAWFLVRLIEPPAEPLPLPRHEVILARGPFAAADELALLRRRAIDVLVAKNSGGAATYGKIEAARELQMPVVLLRRPPAAEVERVAAVEDAAAWATAGSG